MFTRLRLPYLVLAALLSACSAAPSLPPTSADARPAAPAAASATAPLPSPSAAPSAQQPAEPSAEPSAAPSAQQPAEPSAEPSAALAAVEMLPRDPIALAVAFRGLQDPAPTMADAPRQLAVGDVEQFWLIDRASAQHYQRPFTLRYAGPVALIYVEEGVEVDQAAIERNAATFEQEIYPRNRALFGPEWSPGVDGDPRLTLLLANLPGVGGYFSSSDSLPAAVNRFSNQRESFYINVGRNPGPALDLRSVLAHEFQHMIHWNRQRGSPTWFNEGLSTLAEDLNGAASETLPLAYLRDTDLQLTGWTYRPPRNSAHYGAAQLFFRYVHEHYSGDAGLARLIELNAGRDPEQLAALARANRPDVESFAWLVGDWATANLLNDPSVADGRFAYRQLPTTATPQDLGVGTGEGQAAQFGADYLRLPPGPLALRFDGADAARLLPAELNGFAYWSNAGDNSMATLTRRLDLSGLGSATLEFDAWYEIETDYDYAFVSASTDGGATWQTLPGSSTTTEDPQGVNYGHGYTGVSGSPGAATVDGPRGQWLRERVDLSPVAGQPVLLRFWYLTDDAEHAGGMLVDNLSVPELGWSDDAERGDPAWQQAGWARTGLELPQRWELRLVRQSAAGTSVERLPVDALGRAEAQVAEGEQATLVVLPVTPFAREPVPYSYEVVQ
jgi:immune inhibitor A